MKIEHRFSFFIVQLAKKMNDPNIHALIFIFLGIKELKMKKWKSILFCFQTYKNEKWKSVVNFLFFYDSKPKWN